jgi:phospholipase/carboxylesterase
MTIAQSAVMAPGMAAVMAPGMAAVMAAATSGAPLARAGAAMILLHGRGATAESMLGLADVFAEPDVAYIAPQAPGNTWYPFSFLAPIQQNEPYLSRSLAAITELVVTLSAQGFGAERLVLLGFSQGGCLALEFAARNARRYGAVIGLSAGLIGPKATPQAYAGSLAGTPVFLGCSDIDAHVPLRRVQETARTLRALGGHVVERIYPRMGHTINDDEITQVRTALAGLLHATAPAETIHAS